MKSSRKSLWTASYLTISLSNMLVFFNLHLLLSTIPVYVREQFQTSDTIVGLVTTLFASAAIGSRIITARLLLRGYGYALLIAGVAISMTAAAGYAWTDSVVGVLLTRMASGIGFGITSTLLSTLVTRTIPEQRLGEGIGYFSLWSSLASSMGPLFGLWLLQQVNLAAMLMAAFTVVAVLFLPLLLQPGWFRWPASTEEERSVSSMVLPGLGLPSMMHLFIGMIHGSIYSFIALLGKEHGIPNMGVFFVCFALAAIVIRPASGKLDDRYGRIAVMLPGGFFLASSLFVLSIAVSPAGVAAAGILYGAGYGAISASMQTWMLRSVPPERRGTSSGLYYNSLDLGVASGSFLLGYVADMTGYSMMYRYAILLVGAFLLLLMIRSWTQPSTPYVRAAVKSGTKAPL